MGPRCLVRLGLLGLALSFTAGCSDSKTGEVSGTVKYNGEPVKAGAITFINEEGNAPTAGAAIKDGHYTAANVPIGIVRVKINGQRIVGKKKLYDTEDSPEGIITAELLPPEYHEKSEMTFEVRPGKNIKEFDLKDNK